MRKRKASAEAEAPDKAHKKTSEEKPKFTARRTGGAPLSKSSKIQGPKVVEVAKASKKQAGKGKDDGNEADKEESENEGEEGEESSP